MFEIPLYQVKAGDSVLMGVDMVNGPRSIMGLVVNVGKEYIRIKEFLYTNHFEKKNILKVYKLRG